MERGEREVIIVKNSTHGLTQNAWELAAAPLSLDATLYSRESQMINREVTIVETYCSNNHSNVQQKCYVVLIVTAGEQERERERITRTVRIYKIIKLCETCASCQLANNSSVLLFDFLRAAIQLSFAKLPALFKTQSLCKFKLPSPLHRCLHINYSMHCTALLIIILLLLHHV